MDPIIANTFNIIATKNNFSEPTTLSEIEKAVKSGINSQVAEGFLTSPQAAKAYNQFLKAKQGLDENGLYVPVFKEGGKIKIKKYANAAGPLMAEEAAPIEEAPAQPETTAPSFSKDGPPKKIIPGQAFQVIFNNLFTGHSSTDKSSFSTPGTFGSFVKNLMSPDALTFSAAGAALLENNVEDEYVEAAYNEVNQRLTQSVVDTLDDLKGTTLGGIDFNDEGIAEFKEAITSGNNQLINNALRKIQIENINYFSINANARNIINLYVNLLPFKTEDNKVNINELKSFLNSEDQDVSSDIAKNLLFTSLAGKALTSGSKNPNVIAVNDLLTAKFNPKEILDQETKDYENAKNRTWGAIGLNTVSVLSSLASIGTKVIRAAKIAKNASNTANIVRGWELILDRISAATGAGGSIMDVINDVLDDRDPLVSAALAAAELIPGAGDIIGSVRAIKTLKNQEKALSSLTRYLTPNVTDGFDIVKVGEAIGKRNNRLYNREFLTSLSRNLGIAVGTKSARVLYGLQALEDLDNRQAREQWIAKQASSQNPEVKIVTSKIPVDTLKNEERQQIDEQAIEVSKSDKISQDRKKIDFPLAESPATKLNTTYGNAAEYALTAGAILSAPKFITTGFNMATGVYKWITKPNQVKEIVTKGKDFTLTTTELLKKIPDNVSNKADLQIVQKAVQQGINKGKNIVFKTYEGKNYVVIGQKALEIPKPKLRIPLQNSKGGLLIRKHKIGQYLKAYPKASFGTMLKKGAEYLGSNLDARDLASIGQVAASIPTKLHVPQKPLSAATPLPGIAPQQNYINKISEAQFTIPQTSSSALNTLINASMLNQQLDFKNKYAHQFNQLEQQRSLQNQQTAANNLAKNDEIAAKNTMLDNENRLSSAKMKQAAMETFRKNMFAAMQDKFMREDADMQKYITAGATYTQARQQAADAAVGNVAQEYQRRSILQQQLATKEQWVNTLTQQLNTASEENKARIQEAIDLENQNIELTKQNIAALDKIINPVFETAQGIRNSTLEMQRQLLEQLKPKHSKFSFPLKKSGGTISYYKEAKETISSSTKSSNSDGRKHFADAFKYAKFLDFQIKNLQRVQKATDDAMDHLRRLREKA